MIAAPSAEDVIRFYRSDEKPYGAFSNLFRCPVRFGGRDFPTAEHAYQFQKPRKLKVREWLMAAPSPALLASAAHGLYKWDIVSNWSRLKEMWMRGVLQAKFGQNDDLRLLLLGTGHATLIETGTVDNAVNRYWGQVNGRGKNRLGHLLMGVRADFDAGIVTPDLAHMIAEGMDEDGKPDPAVLFHPLTPVA